MNRVYPMKLDMMEGFVIILATIFERVFSPNDFSLSIIEPFLPASSSFRAAFNSLSCFPVNSSPTASRNTSTSNFCV